MHKFLGVLLVAAMIAGCGSKPTKPLPSDTSNNQQGANSAGQEWTPAGDAGEGTEVPGPQEGLLAKRIIYFDFDSSEIRGDGTAIIASHAKHLASTQGLKVRLEGHTDERGSREYNIGLGERRAQAVRRALMLQGATEAQLSTVSYGEERPAAAGGDETAWQQNRRVEIIYLQ